MRLYVYALNCSNGALNIQLNTPVVQGEILRSSLTVVLILNFRDSIGHPAQCVQHGNLGEGVVLSYEGAGAHTLVEINFADAGRKRLVLAYANLAAL